MEKEKILFFDTKPYDRLFFDQANTKSAYQFSIKYLDGHLTEETVGFCSGYDVVCAFVNDTLNESVIHSLSDHGVKLIAMRCAGYNNVDLKATYGKISVVRVPGYSPNAVAEHAAALLFALNRKTHKAYARTRDGNFSINGLLGFDLNGKTAGIIGTGKIGRCLIDIVKGCGMKVLVYDTMPDQAYAQERGIAYVSLDEIYAQSDVISLHCPLTPETHHMINRDTLKKMKKGVILLNTGRGGLIKTADLIEELKTSHIGAAGLDVYEEESEYFFEDFSVSVISDDILARLLMFPNVLVTSHQAFFTQEALANIADTTLGNIREFFNNGYLQNEICYRCGNTCQKKHQRRCF